MQVFPVASKRKRGCDFLHIEKRSWSLQITDYCCAMLRGSTLERLRPKNGWGNRTLSRETSILAKILLTPNKGEAPELRGP